MSEPKPGETPEELTSDILPADGSPGHPGPIDFAYLDWYTAGDRTVRADVLAIFRNQASLWLDQFDADMADADWKMLAHSLKGSARGIGAFALGDLAERAETLIGEGRSAERAALIGEMREALGAVHAEIDRVAA